MSDHRGGTGRSVNCQLNVLQATGQVNETPAHDQEPLIHLTRSP
jgi:hypothetical protein